jgi:hypothetical protein
MIISHKCQYQSPRMPSHYEKLFGNCLFCLEIWTLHYRHCVCRALNDLFWQAERTTIALDRFAVCGSVTDSGSEDDDQLVASFDNRQVTFPSKSSLTSGIPRGPEQIASSRRRWNWMAAKIHVGVPHTRPTGLMWNARKSGSSTEALQYRPATGSACSSDDSHPVRPDDLDHFVGNQFPHCSSFAVPVS